MLSCLPDYCISFLLVCKAVFISFISFVVMHNFRQGIFMFWSRYVALCDKIGKAPNVVAAEVGVKSSGTVTGWKNGAKPRDGILQKLSAYFGVSVEYLTGEQKNTVPISEDGKAEILSIFESLSPDRRSKLLELARLYLADQRKIEETK